MTQEKIVLLFGIIMLLLYGLVVGFEAVCRYLIRKTDEQITESERKHANESNIDYDVRYYFG